MTPLEELTEAIQAINPELRVIQPELGLEDVLRAIKNGSLVEIRTALSGDEDHEYLDMWIEDDVFHSWLLGQPLHEQSPETIQFLSSILNTGK